ncbi:MAG TPA: ATP-binding protein [Kofleriaceae bacterium]|nr:ATP-binding protein [Kofleriaceae bacterium]
MSDSLRSRRDAPTAPPESVQSDVLAALALSRARLLSPVLFAAMLVWCIVIQVSEHPTPTSSLVNFATCAVAGVVTVASRRITAARWGHALCALLWCAPVASSLFSQWMMPQPLNAVLVPLEMVGTAVLLDTRWVICMALASQAMWISLSLRADSHDALMLVMTGLTAQGFAFVMQVLIRRALVVHVTTASELKVQLAERVRLEEQLLHSQRMDAVGTLAAGLAHDMNNVLGSITSFASLLDGEVQSARGRADLDQIVAQSLRGAELTRGLLAYSRHGKYRKQALRVDDVVRDVLPMLARTLPRSIAIRDQLGGAAACIEGDPTQLGQVLVNLSLNAARAMADHGTLEIATGVVALDGEAAAAVGLPPGRYARFEVSDTGVGMDDATRRRVFEPFFTTKPAGNGTGLGLSTVWGIIQSHHGAVDVDSTPGHGSTFTFHLPVTAALAPALPAPRPAPPSTPRVPRSGTVLIADDEPAVLAGTARIIERMGLATLRATNGEEALAQYRQHAGSIDLVVLDMGMPVMGGAECFHRLRETSDVPVLIATGYAVDAEVQAVVARGAELIEKPYASRDLVAIVSRLVEAAACAA